MGVACESSPACPHWSHAGRRGVSVLCQQLTWCSAEGLLVSSLPPLLPLLSPPFLSFFFWNLKFGGQCGVGKGERLHTHTHTHTSPRRHEWPIWHTDINCVQENFWQLHVAADMFRRFNLSTAKVLSSSGRLRWQQETSPPTAGSYRRSSSIHAYMCTSTTLYRLLRTHWLK